MLIWLKNQGKVRYRTFQLRFAAAALRPKDKSGDRDRQLALMAVTKSGSAFRYVSSKLRNDKDVRRAYERQLAQPEPTAAAFSPEKDLALS